MWMQQLAANTLEGCEADWDALMDLARGRFTVEVNNLQGTVKVGRRTFKGDRRFKDAISYVEGQGQR